MSACLPDVACVAVLTLKFVDKGGGHVRWEFVFVVKKMFCFESFKIRYDTCIAQELIDSAYTGRDHHWAFLDVGQTVVNKLFVIVSWLFRKSFIKTLFDEGGMIGVLNENCLLTTPACRLRICHPRRRPTRPKALGIKSCLYRCDFYVETMYIFCAQNALQTPRQVMIGNSPTHKLYRIDLRNCGDVGNM